WSNLAYIGLAYLSSTSPDLLTCLTSHDLLIFHMSYLLCSICLSFARLTYLLLDLLSSTHLSSARLTFLTTYLMIDLLILCLAHFAGLTYSPLVSLCSTCLSSI